MTTGYSGLQGDTNLSDTIANFENIDLSTATNAVLITGDAGSNTLTGGAGSDTLNGGAGNDTAIFSGSKAQYTFQESGKTLIVLTHKQDGMVQIRCLQLKITSLVMEPSS